ncbi:MAG: hypothetical protein EXQ48_04575 [Acidobacteria bacterium]|nr:hypothetical protein [Acidobacteriota bacterium]
MVTKRPYGVIGVLSVVVLGLTLQGCSGSNETAAPAGTTQGQASTPPSQPGSAGQNVAIEFRSEPDPPASGDNTFEVVVTQPDGSAVTDATVEVVFSMPAMPSMNMPAMRSVAVLSHQGSGRYRGSGELSMDGTWTVIVTASRGAEELGRRTFSVVAQ